MNVQNYFLHALMDQGLLTIRHIPGNINDFNVFTKKMTAVVFNHQIPHHVGHDEYGQVQEWVFCREAVWGGISLRSIAEVVS